MYILVLVLAKIYMNVCLVMTDNRVDLQYSQTPHRPTTSLMEELSATAPLSTLL